MRSWDAYLGLSGGFTFAGLLGLNLGARCVFSEEVRMGITLGEGSAMAVAARH